MLAKEYPKAIKDLEEYRQMIIDYFTLQSEVGHGDPDASVSLTNLRREINQKTPVIKYYFEQVGQTTILHGRLPAAIGGHPYAIDVLDSLFERGGIIKPETDKVIDMLDQCVGKYKFMTETKKTMIDMEAVPIIEIINTIEQNLRKCFKLQPKSEIEVQDEVEKILNIKQANFNRETESFSYSSKAYKPDFVLKDFKSVIEIKYCNSKSDEKRIIAEINDDVQAYLSKYKLAIFFIYDVTVIRDVDLFTKDLMQNPKVIVRIIKH